MTPSATDAELLSAYLKGSEEAFRALADRYIGLIYAMACRAAGPALAEDITQAVFILLARRAQSIRDPQFLPAWLLKVTRYCAADARRGALRRKKHEQRAAAMAARLTTDDPADALELLHLDAALQALSPTDRTTILLRFFREQSLAQVATSLNISEVAAKKRVARALDKLRQQFLRSGVPLAAPVFATAVAAALARQASAAPPLLATKICTVALSNSAATTTAALIAKGAVKLMAYTTAKWTAAAAAAVLLVTAATAVVISHRAPPTPPPVPSAPPTSLVAIALPTPAPAASAPAIATIPHDPDPIVNIRDIATNQPIEGVQIELSSDPPGDANTPITTGITNATGTASMTLPATISDRLEISAHKDGYVPVETSATRVFPGDTLPATFSLQLEKATTIGGQVLDEQGRPLESALVEVIIFKQYKNFAPNLPLNLRTTTDAQGKWSLNAAPAQCDKITMGAFHKSCASDGLFLGAINFTDASIPELRRGTAILTLTRGTPIHAILHGPDGKPVKGSIGISDMRTPSRAVPEIPTSKDGQFEVVPTVGKPFYLAARADGCASRIVACQASDPQPFIINLQSATPLNVRIVDPSGHAIANAVLATDYYKSDGRHFSGVIDTFISDADGRISWPQAFDETEYVNIRARGYLQQSDIGVTPGRQNEIIMLPRFVIRASVIDDDTHQPANGFRVVEGNYDAPDHQSIRYSDFPYWEQSSHIRHTGPGTFDFTDADQHDQFVLHILGGDYEPTDSTTIFTDGHDQSFTIHVHKGDRLAGTLLDISGKPLPKTRVYLQTGWLDINNANMPTQPTVEPGYDDSAYFAMTDAKGQFSFSPQKGNLALMVSTDAGYALTRRSAFEGNNNVLQLLPWAKLEGKILSGGKPVPNTPITGAFLVDDTLDNELGPGCSFTAKTDQDGRFSFPRTFVGSIIFVGDSALQKNSTVFTYPGETAHVTIEMDNPVHELP